MNATVNHEVPFHDVDSLGIVWHGHYYKYFELARTALYRQYGFDYDDMDRLGLVVPVIESQCRYSDALRYGQKICITARFLEWEYYILTGYVIVSSETGKRIAYGHTKQAVCDKSGHLHAYVPQVVSDIITSKSSGPPNEAS